MGLGGSDVNNMLRGAAAGGSFGPSITAFGGGGGAGGGGGSVGTGSFGPPGAYNGAYGNTSASAAGYGLGQLGGTGGTGGYGPTRDSALAIGGSAGSGLRPSAVSRASVLGTEEQLVDDICAQAGMRPMPNVDDLRKFVESASNMDGLKIAELLMAKMVGGTSLFSLCRFAFRTVGGQVKDLRGSRCLG